MKQFIRNFNKQKFVGTLNICSLSLSIMVAIVVGLWAINELSFDNFHKNGDKMYRVVQDFEMNNQFIVAASAFKPLGEIAQATIPGIEAMCRVVKEVQGITILNMVNFGVVTLITDNNFFNFFSFPLKEGDIKTVFSGPDKVIITESAAKKYFPGVNPIGEQIISHGKNLYVTGIMYDFPINSHLQGEIVLPLFDKYQSREWDSSFNYATYFIISENADLKAIEKQLTAINKTGTVGFIETDHDVRLEKLSEVHFSKTGAEFEDAVKGDKSFLRTLIFTAVIILIIGCINFANLFISTAFIRAKSIGIKKSQGAGRKTLIMEFYKETAIYVLLSVGIGILFAMIAFPVFNSYTGTTVEINFFEPRFYLFLISLIIITILLSGSFPAFRITRFTIIETLGGKFRGKKMSVFQKILIIIQFTSSISLLIIVFFFGKQIDTLLSQDLGFDNKNIICVNGWRSFGVDFKGLRNELTKNPSIADVAMKQYQLPIYGGNGIGARNRNSSDATLIDLCEVSPNYFDFFGMEIIDGENPFLLESSVEQPYCVINESLARVLGLENPVDDSFIIISIGGKLAEHDGKPFTVKGVVKDAYVKSLYQEPDPQMYLNLSRYDHNPIFIKFIGNSHDVINTVEKLWYDVNPDVPFVYHFLNEIYDAQYISEVNSRNVMGFALIITFIISAAGLFAMAYYSTQRRIKEISIRKVNGAKVMDLLLLLNKDILLWIFISFLTACPIAYLFLQKWLTNFVIKTPLSLWVFVIAGLLSAVIALLTVSYQTWRIATTNPVQSLKIE